MHEALSFFTNVNVKIYIVNTKQDASNPSCQLAEAISELASD
jgi:hypothetical protein